jgi:hypothetical protein
MKLSRFILMAMVVLPGAAFSQIRWQTTHVGTSSGDCQLMSSKIGLTVYPFHVDVEEEAIIATLGTVWWGDSSTLEIFGEFTLSKGAALRSMLLWNGNTVLKAKLRDRTEADSAYEDVVDRDKPRVFARDPALIEYLGNDRYRIKIYPVRINNARKIRILYTVPFLTTGGGPRFQVMPVFLSGCLQTPTQIPVEIRKSSTVSPACIIAYGSVMKTIQFGATYQIPVTDLIVNQYSSWGSLIGQSLSPLFINPDSTVKILSYTACIDSGRAPGNYTAVFATLPDTIKAEIKEISSNKNYTIEAMLNAGEKTYITDFNQKAFIGAYIKSSAPWDSAIHWNLYNSQGKSVLEYSQHADPVSDSLTRSMLPLIWGAKYSLVEGNDNLGALFGFVDRKMSLLALESDCLPAKEAAEWTEAGVPPLNPDEIVIKPSHLPIAPENNVIFELATGIRVAKADALSIAAVVMMPNRMFRITLSKPVSGVIRVVLYDISGKVLATWTDVRPVGSQVELALPARAKGCMIVRVHAGQQMIQKKFILAQ